VGKSVKADGRGGGERQRPKKAGEMGGRAKMVGGGKGGGAMAKRAEEMGRGKGDGEESGGMGGGAQQTTRRRRGLEASRKVAPGAVGEGRASEQRGE
jgi:hypothetical protein